MPNFLAVHPWHRARIHWQTMSVSRQHFNLSCERENRRKERRGGTGEGGSWVVGRGGRVEGPSQRALLPSRRRCPGLLHGLPSICSCAPSLTDNHQLHVEEGLVYGLLGVAKGKPNRTAPAFVLHTLLRCRQRIISVTFCGNATENLQFV